MTSQEVETVIAPGIEGEFGILPGHINFLSGIIPGELRYYDGTKWEHMCVTYGFSEVSGDRVSILVDSAERPVDIDLDRAQKAMERARGRLAQDRDNKDVDILRAENALKRAMARLKVAKKSQ